MSDTLHAMHAVLGGPFSAETADSSRLPAQRGRIDQRQLATPLLTASFSPSAQRRVVCVV
jgi:hypothetical protein